MEHRRGQSSALVPVPINSGKLVEQRRKERLCFHCGDRYAPRLQCRRQLLLIEGDEEMLENDDGELP